MLISEATKSVTACLSFCELRPVAVQDAQAFRSVTDKWQAFPCSL